jgi:hypothetical protein
MIAPDCLSRIGEKSSINPSMDNGRFSSAGIPEDNDFEPSQLVFSHLELVSDALKKLPDVELFGRIYKTMIALIARIERAIWRLKSANIISSHHSDDTMG